MFKKETLLFIILGGFFIANALIAEFIGVKIFSLESTLGIEPLNMTIWGVKDLSFNLTAGVLLWPVVFILTDIINEYYGLKGVKILSWLTAGLIAYAFLMIAGSLLLDPAGFWVERQLENGEVINMERSYDAILGQGNWIIIGSLVAFLIGQWADVRSFHIVRKLTGEKLIWARATGS